MFKYLCPLFCLSSVAFGALPPHFERVLNYAVSQAASLFPFDGISKVEFIRDGGANFFIQTDSGCIATVKVLFKQDTTVPPPVGPAEFDKIEVLEKNCPTAPQPANN
jgi:hypothetical protein